MLRNLTATYAGKRMLASPYVGILAETIAAETATGDYGPGILYNESVDPAYAGKRLRAWITDPPTVGSLVVSENGSVVGYDLPDGPHTFHYDLIVDDAYDSSSYFDVTVGAVDAVAAGGTGTGGGSGSGGDASGDIAGTADGGSGTGTGAGTGGDAAGQVAATTGGGSGTGTGSGSGGDATGEAGGSATAAGGTGTGTGSGTGGDAAGQVSATAEGGTGTGTGIGTGGNATGVSADAIAEGGTGTGTGAGTGGSASGSSGTIDVPAARILVVPFQQRRFSVQRENRRMRAL